MTETTKTIEIQPDTQAEWIPIADDDNSLPAACFELTQWFTTGGSGAVCLKFGVAGSDGLVLYIEDGKDKTEHLPSEAAARRMLEARAKVLPVISIPPLAERKLIHDYKPVELPDGEAVMVRQSLWSDTDKLVILVEEAE